MAVPNVTLGDLLRIRATAYMNGQTAVWGSDVRVASSVGVGLTLPQFAAALTTIFDAEIPDTIADDATVSDLIVELLVPTTGQVAQSALGISTRPVGTGGATAVPTQAAAIVRKITGLAGPSHRGRMYWPFLTSDMMETNGEITAAAKTAITLASISMFGPNTLTSGANSVTLNPILIHRGVGPVVVTYDDIITFLTGPKIGTQRRRGDYGKPNPII